MTNYFGGRGAQGSVLWRDGAVVHGPEMYWSDGPARRPPGEWPINRALRGLGVAKGAAFDEFDAFGLPSFRSYESLVAGARAVAL